MQEHQTIQCATGCSHTALHDAFGPDADSMQQCPTVPPARQGPDNLTEAEAALKLQSKWRGVHSHLYIGEVLTGMYYVSGVSYDGSSLKHNFQEREVLTIAKQANGNAFPFCTCKREYFHTLMRHFESSSPFSTAQSKSPSAVCVHMAAAALEIAEMVTDIHTVTLDMGKWICGKERPATQGFKSDYGLVVWGGYPYAREPPLPALVLTTSRKRRICTNCKRYGSGRTNKCRHVRFLLANENSRRLVFSDDELNSGESEWEEAPPKPADTPAWRSTGPIPRLGIDEKPIRTLRSMYDQTEAALSQPANARLPPILEPTRDRCVCNAGAMVGKHTPKLIAQAALSALEWYDQSTPGSSDVSYRAAAGLLRAVQEPAPVPSLRLLVLQAAYCEKNLFVAMAEVLNRSTAQNTPPLVRDPPVAFPSLVLDTGDAMPGLPLPKRKRVVDSTGGGTGGGGAGSGAGGGAVGCVGGGAEGGLGNTADGGVGDCAGGGAGNGAGGGVGNCTGNGMGNGAGNGMGDSMGDSGSGSPAVSIHADPSDSDPQALGLTELTDLASDATRASIEATNCVVARECPVKRWLEVVLLSNYAMLAAQDIVGADIVKAEIENAALSHAAGQEQTVTWRPRSTLDAVDSTVRIAWAQYAHAHCLCGAFCRACGASQRQFDDADYTTKLRTTTVHTQLGPVIRQVATRMCRRQGCGQETHYQGHADAVFVWSKKHAFDYDLLYACRANIKATTEPLKHTHNRMTHTYLRQGGVLCKPPSLSSVLRPAYYAFESRLEPIPDRDYTCEQGGCGQGRMGTAVLDALTLGVRNCNFEVREPTITQHPRGWPEKDGLAYRDMVLIHDPKISEWLRRLGGGSERAARYADMERHGVFANAGEADIQRRRQVLGEKHGTKRRKTSKPLSQDEYKLLIARVASQQEYIWLRPLLVHLRTNGCDEIGGPAGGPGALRGAAGNGRGGGDGVGVGGGTRLQPKKGGYVKKSFAGVGTLLGVISEKRSNEDKLWRVTFTSGDWEDFSTSDITPLLTHDRSPKGGQGVTLHLRSLDYRLLLRALGAKGQLYTGTQGRMGILGPLLLKMGGAAYDLADEDERFLMRDCPIIAKVRVLEQHEHSVAQQTHTLLMTHDRSGSHLVHRSVTGLSTHG